MGRTKPKKQAVSKAVDTTIHSPSAKKPSISSLIEKAQSLIVQCDYDLAVRFIQRILEQQPSNVEAKEMLGVVQLETGEIEAAKQTFLSLIPPAPTASSAPPPSAYLYLAQISEDDPRLALQYYQAAIDILTGQLKGKERAANGNESEDEIEIRSNIVRALISQVEIWMDPSYDLCFEPEAEKTCEDLIADALRTDPDNTEALQMLASVRMSQQRPNDAKECLEKSWTCWKGLDIDDPKVPPVPTRLALVRLFLELSLHAPALLVLHGIMSSDDQEVEAWYLEGWCYFLMAEQAKESRGKIDDMTWEELAKDARDRLETCQMLHINEQHPDKPLLEHVRELINKLEAAGIHASPADEEGSDEDEWVDEDSEDEDGDVEMS
ncbi:TPR-like protein [Dendrothele bispora CBS 962.96]|uniref:TPR-like protein n=1 Tax=Dendrothele bispora (strain CBS 962.96) TaxID=1314807 RepID=A0A4S8MKA4_DENBC|nr:TPR-like protein [Dendrothele bispora CBS 962.96]